jgi:ribonuclease BN (tRNA processing enzyme)
MRVLVLGVGDAFTTRGYGSCFLIDGPEGFVLIDCTDLIHRALREAADVAGWTVDSKAIHHILLTHLHGDHCNGLESFGFKGFAERIRGEATVTPTIHTHPGAAARVWERLAPAMDAPLTPGGKPAGLEDFFRLRTFEVGAPFPVAGLTVRARRTHHPIPTVGLLISDGRWTLGVSGDTIFDPEHIAWLDQADVIIHEANYSPLHTQVDPLNNLPARIRTKMRLTHTEDAFDRGSTKIPLLKQGEVVVG